MKFRKLPFQVLQLGTVILIAGAGLFAARARFVPESFGDLGHYRADAVDFVASHELHYAG